MTLKIYFVLASVLLMSYVASGVGVQGAACTGVVGTQRYNSTGKVMQMCTGDALFATWESLDGGSSGGGTCTVGEEGKQKYAAGAMQYCNGTEWRHFSNCSNTSTSCSGAGRQRSGLLSDVYSCDGTFWRHMNPRWPSFICQTELPCYDIPDLATCTANVTCEWDGSMCKLPGCSGYVTPGPCMANGCQWDLGSCLGNSDI